MLRKLTRPTVTDRWLDVAFAIKYLIFAAFGVVGAFWTVPAIEDISSVLYVLLWALSIAIIGVVAATLVFYNIHERYRKPQWVKLEWYCTFLLTGLVLTYSLALLSLSIQGFEGRYSISVLSLALLVFPVWRIRHIYRQLRGKTI